MSEFIKSLMFFYLSATAIEDKMEVFPPEALEAV